MKKQVEKRSKDLKIATKRAVRKTLKWYQSQVIRLCTKELGVKRKYFKGRWFIDAAQTRLWAGVKPMPLHSFGSPRQNKTGVKVNGIQYNHAFLLHNRMVMERTSERRLPIEAVTKEIKSEVLFAFNQVKPLALARFKVILEQELNFVRNHSKS